MVCQDGQIGSVNNYGSTSFSTAIFFTGQSTGCSSTSGWSPISDPFHTVFCSFRPTSSAMDMSSPLENLHPETDPEPVFAQPGPVSSAQTSSGPLHFPARDRLQLLWTCLHL